MTTSTHLARRRTGFGRARAEVKLAWGVDLHTSEAGELHESIADADLTDPFTSHPDLEAIVGTEQHGPDLDGDILVIKRTLTWAGDGLGEITAATITPPTQEEAAAVHAALDHLGYNGPRHIRLLLAVDYQ